MEEMKTSLTVLTGAVNRLLEEMKTMEVRLGRIEKGNDIAELGRRLDHLENLGRNDLPITDGAVAILQVPQTEEDLKSISRLPDSVKELRTFDGNPLHYVSWVHSVEMVLKDFEIVRNKPIYRSIMQSIRQKVVGEADAALVSYNIFDSDWKDVKKILSLHYADKRDVQTLEHQLNQLSQGSLKIDEFYSTVNHHLSLIINKLKTESYSEETVNALITTHRNRALDIFIRGLTPELSRMVIIQRPRTLPEAYSACLELQNLTMRNNILHSRVPNRTNVQSFNNQQGTTTPPRPPRPPVSNYPSNHFKPGDWQQRNNNFPHSSFNQNYRQTHYPRSYQVKQEPMEVDRSAQSRKLNYMNRPKHPEKRSASEMYNRNKQQKLFHLNASHDNVEDYPRDEEVVGSFDDAANEQNFMEEGPQAYLT